MSFPQGFQHFPGLLEPAEQVSLLAEVRRVIALAPLYSPAMPRTGKLLSVRMTNCGELGWLTDKAGGYRYEARHPVTGKLWPPIPRMLLDLWRQHADFAALPEACLVNYYAGAAKLGSHQDADEAERSAPVLSVSLGDSAVFHVGGLKRTDPKTRIDLRSGDAVIFGGQARMAFHGIDRVHAGTSDLLGEGGRINLTLRRVTKA